MRPRRFEQWLKIDRVGEVSFLGFRGGAGAGVKRPRHRELIVRLCTRRAGAACDDCRTARARDAREADEWLDATARRRWGVDARRAPSSTLVELLGS